MSANQALYSGCLEQFVSKEYTIKSISGINFQSEGSQLFLFPSGHRFLEASPCHTIIPVFSKNYT
jgi:hypothetical protein